jgi:hypothetical protein
MVCLSSLCEVVRIMKSITEIPSIYLLGMEMILGYGVFHF